MRSLDPFERLDQVERILSKLREIESSHLSDEEQEAELTSLLQESFNTLPVGIKIEHFGHRISSLFGYIMKMAIEEGATEASGVGLGLITVLRTALYNPEWLAAVIKDHDSEMEELSGIDFKTAPQERKSQEYIMGSWPVKSFGGDGIGLTYEEWLKEQAEQTAREQVTRGE